MKYLYIIIILTMLSSCNVVQQDKKHLAKKNCDVLVNSISINSSTFIEKLSDIDSITTSFEESVHGETKIVYSNYNKFSFDNNKLYSFDIIDKNYVVNISDCVLKVGLFRNEVISSINATNCFKNQMRFEKDKLTITIEEEVFYLTIHFSNDKISLIEYWEYM